MSHAVQQLYTKRKSMSTKAFNARGKKVIRCQLCQLAVVNCICQLRRRVSSKAAFVLIMHDAEVLKPSNTARLIADVIPDTHAFIWSRTEPDPALLTLLADNAYQPFVIFPEQYADGSRAVYINQVPNAELAGKKPLFILLDGSWREARKMFKKSPYLDGFPVLSANLQAGEKIGHYIRDAMVENQLATAQVAATMLDLLGEHDNALHLSLWFDLFNFRYQKSVCQPNQGRSDALSSYQSFIDNQTQRTTGK